LKTEDYGKILVLPITVLQFESGGLNLPPAEESQGSLEKRYLPQELIKREK